MALCGIVRCLRSKTGFWKPVLPAKRCCLNVLHHPAEKNGFGKPFCLRQSSCCCAACVGLQKKVSGGNFPLSLCKFLILLCTILFFTDIYIDTIMAISNISDMFSDGTDHTRWEEMPFSPIVSCMSCVQHTQRIACACQISHAKNILNFSWDY